MIYNMGDREVMNEIRVYLHLLRLNVPKCFRQCGSIYPQTPLHITTAYARHDQRFPSPRILAQITQTNSSSSFSVIFISNQMFRNHLYTHTVSFVPFAV